MNMDDYISIAFKENWTGNHVLSSVENMKSQLYKNLTDQINGYWSGHTAYFIMVNYGFLIDSKHVNKKPKKLTVFGEIFMAKYEVDNNLN